MPQVASTSTCSSMANSAVTRAACLSVSRSARCSGFAGHGRAGRSYGRGGWSRRFDPLAVAEKKGTMILLALGRARWASEIWGVIRFRPYGSPGTWPDEALAVFDPHIAWQ